MIEVAEEHVNGTTATERGSGNRRQLGYGPSPRIAENGLTSGAIERKCGYELSICCGSV
jgi:hypothetical protein